MPAGTNGGASAKRFELPALNLNLPSLTEGTDIPPPPPSPVLEEVDTPPQTPTEADEKEKTAANRVAPVNNVTPDSTMARISTGGLQRPAEDPSSPTLSTRPNSVRRLFSRNLLSKAYAHGEEPALDSAHMRPPSAGNASTTTEGKKKRTSWFNRFRAGDSHHAHGRGSVSTTTGRTSEDTKIMGPPPPMIPELSELQSKMEVEKDGSFGGDLFKDIK